MEQNEGIFLSVSLTLPEQAWSIRTRPSSWYLYTEAFPSKDPGEISKVSYQFKQESESEWPVGFAERQQGKGIVLSHFFRTHDIKYVFEGDIGVSILGDT